MTLIPSSRLSGSDAARLGVNITAAIGRERRRSTRLVESSASGRWDQPVRTETKPKGA
ncbi:MAG: hypothetical protein ACLFVU_15010 [Phycisphaerae bacterium]